LHRSELVELDDGLGHVEVDGAAPVALAVQKFGQLLHALESWNEFGEFRARGLVVFQNLMDLRVGHAAGGADHALGDFVARYIAAGVNVHEAGEDEAVFVGAQTAKVRGKILRQHGNVAVGEVDGVAAQPRLQIKRGSRANVLGHVGNVDLEPPVAGCGIMLNQHGVIKVAGRFAVDGDDGQMAEVAPRGYFLWVKMSDGEGLGQHVLREDTWQVVLADDHLNVDAEIFFMAENLDDTASRGAFLLRPMRDLDIDNQALQIVAVIVLDRRRGLLPEHAMRRSRHLRNFRAMRNEHRLGHALVKGHNVVPLRAGAVGVVKNADHRGIAPREHAGDAAQTASVTTRRSQLDQHLIALHSSVDLVGRDEDVFFARALAFVGADKAEAV